jgi:hypothetical protein
MAHGPYSNSLPDLKTPAFVNDWRRGALITAAIFAVASAVLAYLAASLQHDGFQHLLRSYLMGFVLCWSFALGGQALLMLQYLTGGKWGLVVRRPLEAMARTLPLVALLFLPIGFCMKRLYLWARISDPAAAFKAHLITHDEAHAIAWKRPMLGIGSVWIQTIICFAIWFTFLYFMDRWSVQRDADPEPHVHFWQTRFENISGFGLVIYSITMTVVAIDWVMSLDVTWYSSMYGFLFLVGQGYAAFALVIYTTLKLSKAEPLKTVLRVTEQHDLGKLAFAFVMLNIYIAYSQFLIIWSGNLPDEIPWYLDRIRGGWGVIATLDFVFHWLVPFTLLLSRDIKRNKRRLMLVCGIMIFARCWDTFWLIAPNFPDAARNLHLSFGLFEYVTVPITVGAIWMWYYFTQLQKRPIVQTNDPHFDEIMEAQHAHA